MHLQLRYCHKWAASYENKFAHDRTSPVHLHSNYLKRIVQFRLSLSLCLSLYCFRVSDHHKFVPAVLLPKQIFLRFSLLPQIFFRNKQTNKQTSKSQQQRKSKKKTNPKTQNSFLISSTVEQQWCIIIMDESPNTYCLSHTNPLLSFQIVMSEFQCQIGWDFGSLLCPGEATLSISVLLSSQKARNCWSLVQGHKGDKGPGASPLWEKAERAGAVHSGEGWGRTVYLKRGCQVDLSGLLLVACSNRTRGNKNKNSGSYILTWKRTFF